MSAAWAGYAGTNGAFSFISVLLQISFSGSVYGLLEVFVMTIIRRMTMVAMGFVLLPAFALAQEQEQEKKIQRSDLPQAVEHTVVEQSKGALIKGFSQEEENGQTFYEAELLANGHSKDVLMDANGSVVQVEEWISMTSLPSAVRTGLQAKAGDARLSRSRP